jgi:hypothetical protein
LARALFDTGIYSVLTSGGAIGVGWKLNFYTAGTATPITTYNAPSAGSANSNPVIAQADGRFDDIWIPDGQSIKWTLTDENDVVKATVDNFPISSAAPTVAAGLVNFLAGSAALPIANGGTNATSAANALTNLGALPAAGGTVSGNITRTGKGCHVYFSDAAMTTPKVFITASGAADPRAGVPGEIWLKY